MSDVNLKSKKLITINCIHTSLRLKFGISGEKKCCDVFLDRNHTHFFILLWQINKKDAENKYVTKTAISRIVEKTVNFKTNAFGAEWENYLLKNVNVNVIHLFERFKR